MRVHVGWVVALFIAHGALAQDAGVVVIYRTQTPYSNIVRLPAGARESMKPYLQPGRVEMVDWSAFKSDPQRYLAPTLVKNEYPASNMPKLVVDLLEGFPGIPVGVTWTGGIAVSKDERTHAERIYQLFREKPEEYERTKVSSDQARDPIHPQHRLGPTLVVVRKPEGPWWKCQGDNDDGPPRTPDQQRRLEDFGLDRFSPKAPGPNRTDQRLSRGDLMKRFGQPLRTSSKKIPRDRQDPYDKALRIITTWEYPGFRIVTAAEESSPNVLWIESGEFFDAKISLDHAVGVGQSIEQWERQFGRPQCRMDEEPPLRRHFQYEWEASYFACTEDKTYRCQGAYQMELYIDASGKVVRMTWSIGSMH